MEKVTIKMTPRTSGNQTIIQETTNVSHTISGVIYDTYDYEITSDAFNAVSGTVVVDARNETVNIDLVKKSVEAWISKSRTRPIAFQTQTKKDNTLLPSESYTTAGVNGVETQTYEEKHVNGVATGQERNVSPWVITTPSKPEVIVTGTKVETVPITGNILTPSNVLVAGNTDLQINGVRADSQIITELSRIELRQWAEGFGGVNIRGADLSGTNKDYTLAFKYQVKTTNVSSIKSTGNQAFWNHKAYIDGNLVSERNDAEITSAIYPLGLNTIHEFVYQFNTGTVTDASIHLLQWQFNNDVTGISSSNDAKVWLMDVAIYEGHVQPFGA